LTSKANILPVFSLPSKAAILVKICISIIYPPPQYFSLTLPPCLVFILFYLANVQTDPLHRNPFQEKADKVFANLKANKHIFLMGKNTFLAYRQAGILVSHTGSLHASVPVMAITQPT